MFTKTQHMNAINALQWRAAIKEFDPEKKVSDQDIEVLLDAANLAPTSGGFQPFKIIALSNQEVKERLQAVAFGQKQVGDASHVLVFAMEQNVDDNTVDQYIQRAAEVRQIPAESMDGYAASMKGFISGMDDAAKTAWTRSQAYIALGTVMLAAASMQIDTCPMEGFAADQCAEVLGLDPQQHRPVVMLPIGYRVENEQYASMPKVRKTKENLVLNIK